MINRNVHIKSKPIKHTFMTIPFKSKLKAFRNIQNRNKAFNKLSKKEQRQEIAYDALMLVVNRKIIPHTGDYWDYKFNNITAKTPEKFQEKLLKVPRGCQVCQRGLCMLSQIRLSNTLSPDEYQVNQGRTAILKGFTMRSFHAMENAFELWNKRGVYQHTSLNTKERSANICCNVIANGDFEKKDKTNYLVLWNIKL